MGAGFPKMPESCAHVRSCTWPRCTCYDDERARAASAHYVNYTVTLDRQPREFQSGPYPNMEIAEWDAHDIGTYSAVTNCYITQERDPHRTLIAFLQLAKEA